MNDVANTRNIPVHFIANDPDNDKHEKAIGQFASFLNIHQYGALKLVQMLNTRSCEPEYLICAVWHDLEGEGDKLIPVARMLTGDIVDGQYALPDGDGGWVGVVNSLEEAFGGSSDDKAEETSDD